MSNGKTVLQADQLPGSGSASTPIPADLLSAVHSPPLPSPAESLLVISKNMLALRQLSDLNFLLSSLSPAAQSRFITGIGTTPVQLIPPAKTPRAYLLQNTTNSIPQPSPIFSSLLRTTAGSPYTMSTFDTRVYRNLFVFLNVTALNGVTAFTVDHYTKDPLTTAFALTKADLFAGQFAVATSPYLAFLGPTEICSTSQFVATLTGGTSLTFSLTGVTKDYIFDGGGAPPSTQLFLGINASVNTAMGFILYPGQYRLLYLQESTQLWGMADPVTGQSVNVRIWELQ